MNDYDVIIVGSGLTGQTAGYELLKHNRKVAMCRCGLGASPGVSGFNIPHAENQDTVECFVEDTLVSGRGQSDKKLVDKLCNGADKLEDYLSSIGFAFDYNEDGTLKARKSLGSSFNRVVGHGNSSGAQILKILEQNLQENANFTMFEDFRVLRLITEDDKVCGVYGYDIANKQFKSLHSKAVLLCNGGFAGIYPFTSNSKDIGGDGAAMAYLAGCNLVDMEFVQFEPSSAVWPLEIRGKGMITTLFYEGAIMTNGKGERFMLKYSDKAECVNKDVLSQCIEKEILAGNASEHGGVYFDASGVPEERLHDAYEPFVVRYANVGIDLTKEPVELANAAHTSLGGIEIDENCHSNLTGLYVAGEASGHLHGANRIGGSAGSETLVFGQIASKSINEDLDKLGISEKEYVKEYGTECQLTDQQLDQFNKEYKEILQNSVSVYRVEDKLEAGLNRLEKIYQIVVSSDKNDDEETNYKRFRLENDLLTAAAWLMAAKERKDSCGCHQRIDYPDTPKESYHTVIRLENNVMNVSTKEN